MVRTIARLDGNIIVTTRNVVIGDDDVCGGVDVYSICVRRIWWVDYSDSINENAIAVGGMDSPERRVDDRYVSYLDVRAPNQLNHSWSVVAHLRCSVNAELHVPPDASTSVYLSSTRDGYVGEVLAVNERCMAIYSVIISCITFFLFSNQIV